MSKAAFPPADGLRHYYLRDKVDNHPFACVAFKPGPNTGKVIRGISICSHIETWDRVEARKKAAGRCKKAEATCQCDDPVMPRFQFKENVGHVPMSPVEFLEFYQGEFGVPAYEGRSVVNTVFKTGYNLPATKRELRILSKEAEYAAKSKEKQTAKA